MRGGVWTLWVLLIALPLTVLITGCAKLLSDWRSDLKLRDATRQSVTAIRAHAASLVVAGATLTAAGILTIVALHLLAN